MLRIQKRAQEELQRNLEIDEQETKLVAKGLVEKYETPEGMADPVKTMPPTFYEESKDLPDFFKSDKDLDKIFDGLEKDEAAARKMGVMRIEEFELIKANMAQQQMERDTKVSGWAHITSHIRTQTNIFIRS